MEERERVSRFTAVLVVALAALFAGAAMAQSDFTTARIAGVVKDGAGVVLPGVTVEAKNAATGLVESTVTDVDGAYRLINLPTGTYSVTATLAGFATVTAENVKLVLGSAPTVNITMQQAQFAEAVVVTAEVPLVEATNTQTSTTIGTEQLRNLPISGRDFTNLTLLSPEASRENQRNYIALSGQRGVNTSFVVDGADYNNSFFGGTTGTAEGRAPLSISQESIKEFTVITNGTSAEYGRSGGGVVSVLTKSGGNDLSGSLFYYLQPQSTISNFPDGREPADQEKSQYGGSLGGPILKDKLFFFASYDTQDKSETVPLESRVIDDAVFAQWPVLTTDDNYAQTQDGQVLFGRFDFLLGNNHRIMARANYADYEGINGTRSATNYADTYNGVEGMYSRSSVLNWSAVFGENFTNDLTMQYVLEDTPREDKALNLPSIQIQSPAVRYGEVEFLPISMSQDRITIADSVSWLIGKHTLKAGGEYNDTSIEQIFKGNWRGVFIFPNKQALLDGKWIEYRQFGGLQGLTSDEAGYSNFGQVEMALFAQDQWYLSPNLTLSLGLRWESLDNPDFGIINPDDMNANGSYNLTRKIPDQDDMYSPRFGVTWSPAAKTALRLTAGRFYARTPSLLFAQNNTSNGYKGTQYTIRTNAGVAPTDPLSSYVGWGSTWVPEGIERIPFGELTKIPTGVSVYTFPEDYKNAYTDRMTVEWEQQIFSNTGVTFNATYAEAKDLEYLTDLNLQYECQGGGVGTDCDPVIGANGLPRYASARPNTYYGNVYSYNSGARSEYLGISMVVQQRLTAGLSGWLSIGWSEDKDNDSNERNYSGMFVEDKNDLDNNWGFSDRDQTWKIRATGLWDTGFWGLLFSGNFFFNSGTPYSAFTGSDSNNDKDRFTDRPTIDGVHLGRNIYRNDDYWRIDLRLQKSFNLGPGEVSLIAECFNVTDEAYYYVSNTTWGTGQTPLSTFGATSYGGGIAPRTWQFALRYDF
ncbi:MAG: hypothetical protein H6Q02_236 [Acidobacteria bacterium]|nr:hypothetical protein [Acidobacteriota bacterium]